MEARHERELGQRTVVRWWSGGASASVLREREREQEVVRVNEGNGQGRRPSRVKAGRRCRAASLPAHGRHAACSA
jgi:hypothetical protein